MGSKKSSTNTTSNNYDQRVVNDASNGGKTTGNAAVNAESGAIVNRVSGMGNTVTDGGAFALVDKLVSQVGAIGAVQSTVARDIALRDTTQGTIYAQNALQAQAAALNAQKTGPAQAAENEISITPKTAIGLAVFVLVGGFLIRKA